MHDVNGKVAVVTGGGSGIGRGICRALAAKGARVVVADVDGERSDAVARGLSGDGAEALAATVDVSDLASVEALAETTVSRFGGVDVVCNNAGVYVGGSVRDLTPDDWRWVMSVNLDGVFHGCRVFVPLLLASRGHLVNTASLGGLLPSSSAYSASKAAVVSYTEILRADLADDGVGVSCLCPGAVATDLASCDRLRPTGLADAGNSSAVLAASIAGGITPDEAGAITVRGIERNDAFIFTDTSLRSAVEERFDRILADFDHG